MKTCSHCRSDLPLEAFNYQSNGVLGRRAECKDCVKRYTRSKHGVALGIMANQIESCKARGYTPPLYSFDELEAWLFSQPVFHSIYDAWVVSGYKKGFKPSVDRINDYISYRLDNIQIVNWFDNNQKNYTDRMSGKNNKQSLAVDMLDLDNIFIERFHSVSEAARKVNGIPSNIIGAINKRVRKTKVIDNVTYTTHVLTAYGYKWRYSTIPNDNSEIT